MNDNVVMSGPALRRIEESPITELTVTNSIPQGENIKRCKKIRVCLSLQIHTHKTHQ